MAKAALVMTVRDRKRFLREAIDSALAQTEPDIELVIWDDGSTDGAADIARGYVHADPRVRFFTAPAQGRAPALAAAIAQSDAQFFGLIDSDDRIAPTAVAETLAVMTTDPDLGIVYTDHNLMDARGVLLGRGPACATPYSPERLLVEQMVFHFRLFRREIYDDAGGVDPGFESAVDYDLVLRMSETGEVAHVPQALYDYRVHDDSMSGDRDMTQLAWSRRAVENALARRGVADRLRLRVKTTFILEERSPET